MELNSNVAPLVSMEPVVISRWSRYMTVLQIKFVRFMSAIMTSVLQYLGIINNPPFPQWSSKQDAWAESKANDLFRPALSRLHDRQTTSLTTFFLLIPPLAPDFGFMGQTL